MKPKVKRLAVLLALVPVFMGRLSVGETIEHGDLPAGNDVPDGSRAICPGVPDGTAFIPSLRTGWAVARGDEGAVRLVFSSLAIACAPDEGAALHGHASENCESGWSLAFDLEEPLEPGTYDLAEASVNFSESIVDVGDGFACSSGCSISASGSGVAPGTVGPAGTLEIYSVDDECITGRLSGYVSNQIEPRPPEFNGAFHAVRCAP